VQSATGEKGQVAYRHDRNTQMAAHKVIIRSNATKLDPLLSWPQRSGPEAPGPDSFQAARRQVDTLDQL
jgi:hypothetical protein